MSVHPPQGQLSTQAASCTRAAIISRVGALLLVAAMTSCAGDPPAQVLTADGLVPVEHSSADQAWAKPRVDLSRYTKLMLERGGSHYRYVPSDTQDAISLKDRRDFEDRISRAVSKALTDNERYQIAQVPNDDTVTLWGTLADAHIHRSNDNSRVAKFVMVAELRDSISKETLARVVNRYEFALSPNEPDNWLEIDRVAADVALLLARGIAGLSD